ncbi:MAG: hypothetical protein ABJH63_07740 [Rhizobiaceae bacterium]
MVEDVSQLISTYERSVRKLNRLIEYDSAADQSVREVDKAVSRAFDNLLDQDITSADELLEHVDYLLKLIKASHADDTILQRIVDRVWKDIVLLQAGRRH